MTQPRKEQVKNIQAKFSPIDPRIVKGTVGPGLGPSSSSVFVVPGSPSPLATLLGTTITGSLTGCINTSPGYITGTVQGPFVMAAGQQFTITCPQLNAGNPITVTILSNDIVTLGGAPVLTTSRLAARINASLATAMSIAGFTTTVASNFNGFLRLQTPAPGDACTLTLRDLTAGLLNVFIGTNPAGAAASPTMTALGQTSPKRGVVVNSPDGGGGLMPVRMANGEPCTTRQSQRMHMGSLQYVPNTALGQDIYAKISGYQGVSSTISFFTTGILAPSAITQTSNFSTLNATDTLTLTLSDPITLPSPAVLNVSFASAPTTAQAVADLINAQWALVGTPAATIGVAATNKITFAFNDGATFNLILNGSSTVVLVPVSSAVRTQAQLVSAINAAITGASVTGGLAYLSGGSLFIASNITNPLTSSVQLLAGTLGDMSALVEMGISPGIYHGTAVARTYGNDEVVISNPSRNSGASLSISASGATLTKMGLSASAIGVTTGEEPATPGAPVIVLIPEAMEFGEVPDDQDSVVESFLRINRASKLDPTLGIANAGQAAILGPDGILPSSVLAPSPSLSPETINLGTRSVGSASQLLKPRITAVSNSDFGYMLLMVLPDLGLSANTPTIRMYVDSVGNFVRTTNCSWLTSNHWTKDTNGAAAYMTFFGTNGSVVNKSRFAAETSPWLESDWRITSATGSNLSGLSGAGTGGLIQAGFGDVDTTPGQLIPRLEIGVANNGYTLILEAVIDNVSWSARTYYEPSTGAYVRTCNARWDGSNWNKDIPGTQSVFELFGIAFRQTKLRFAVNDTPWTSWDSTPLSEAYSDTGNHTHVLGGQLLLGNTIPNTPTGRGSPRLHAVHNSTTVLQRTLVSTWTGGGGLNFYLYRCYEPSGYFAVNDCMMESVNAYWDEAAGLWRKEQTYNNSMLTVTSGSERAIYFKGGNSPLTWPDTTWTKDLSFAIGGTTVSGPNEGLFVTSTNNPSNEGGLANVLKPGNIPKAWGVIVIVSGTPVISDSYNVSSVSLSGSNTLLVNMTAGLTNMNMSVCCTAAAFAVSISGPANYVASAVGFSNSQFGAEFWPTNSATPINLTTTTGVVLNFAVFGRQ